MLTGKYMEQDEGQGEVSADNLRGKMKSIYGDTPCKNEVVLWDSLMTLPTKQKPTMLHYCDSCGTG